MNEIKDEHFGFNEAPVTVASRISARVTPLSGRELERARQIDPRIGFEVAIRYRTGVTARQTVIYHTREGDRELEIVAPPIDVEERRRELQLLCREAA